MPEGAGKDVVLPPFRQGDVIALVGLQWNVEDDFETAGDEFRLDQIFRQKGKADAAYGCFNDHRKLVETAASIGILRRYPIHLQPLSP